MPDGDNHGLPSLAPALPPEVLLVCPECGTPLAAAVYEAHLRQAHRLHLFRGARRSYTETLALLLNLLAESPPDAEAWRVLATLMRDEHGARALIVLAALLGALLTRVDDARRAAAVDALADLLAAESDGDARLATALAGDGEAAARRLALALVARQRPPFAPALLRPLRALLLDRRLPVEEQFAALAALLRSAGPDGPLAAEFLRRLVGGLGKKQSVRAPARVRASPRRFAGPRRPLRGTRRTDAHELPALLRPAAPARDDPAPVG